MIGRRLVNGVESSAISVDDRGLQYGDGLFETMAAVNGRVRHFERHMERLADGGRRLGLPVPDPDLIAKRVRAGARRPRCRLGQADGHARARRRAATARRRSRR